MRCLSSFHNRCIRIILGVTRYQQWKERITSQRLASTFGMQQLVSDFVMEQCLRWLDHLGLMNNDRLPKKVLFGELSRTRPRHGTKRRWRDVTRSDVEAIGANDDWYELCQDRKEWCELCKEQGSIYWGEKLLPQTLKLPPQFFRIAIQNNDIEQTLACQ